MDSKGEIVLEQIKISNEKIVFQMLNKRIKFKIEVVPRFDLQPIHTKSFVNIFYLTLINSKILFQKILPKKSKHGYPSHQIEFTI